MVDNNNKTPGSITENADSQTRRISEISNVNKTITEMQRNIDQKMAEAEAEIGDVEGIEKVQNSMMKVLSVMGTTVGSIGNGFAKIATETGKASADAVKQYGKAITQDVNVNKQNLLAMTLSRSTPIFGYFAAKFMETDVFQRAKERMKENISSALGSVTSKFREGFGSFLQKIKLRRKKDKSINTVTEAIDEGIPKMAKGGYVKKEGLAYIHPAEVVMPIEKILEKIDDSISITKDLAEISEKVQLNALAKMGTYVSFGTNTSKKNLASAFFSAYKDVHNRYEEPANIRMLRAVLSIQDSMGATVGKWPQVWQKMLIEHPTFRKILFAMDSVGNILGAPFKIAYQFSKSRGGYLSHLSKSRNPMQATSENIGVLYTGSMWRLDNIALFTRATAEAVRDMSSFITGKKYKQLEGIGTGQWSIFGLLRGGLNFATKHIIKGLAEDVRFIFGDKEKAQKFANFLDWSADALTKERKVLIGKRSKQLEGTYGSGGILEAIQDDLAIEIKKTKAIPVYDIYKLNYEELLNSYLNESKKSNKKLLSYTGAMSKDIDTMNKREKRKSIFGAFGGIFKTLFSGGGLLGLAAPLIRMFIGGGTITGTIAAGVTSVVKKLFPGGIMKTIGSLMTPVKDFVTNPKLWQGVSKIAGPAFALAGAAYVGWEMGKAIDQVLGISEKFKAKLNEYDKKSAALHKELAGDPKEKLKKVRSGTQEGYQEYMGTKLQTQFGSTEARLKDVGFFGRGVFDIINLAQQKYMMENINEYMRYSPSEIARVRDQWLKEGGYVSKAMLGHGPETYGMNRESVFLSYLKSKGTPLSDFESAESFAAYQQRQAEFAPNVFEKAMGTVVDSATIVKDKISEGIIQTHLVEGIEDLSNTIKETGKNIGGAVVNQFNNATVAMTNSVNSSMQAVSSGATQVRGRMSKYTEKVLKGDLWED